MSTRPDESRDTGITCCGQPESGCGEFCPRMSTRFRRSDATSKGVAVVKSNHNKTAPGRCANTVHPGASPTNKESTDG